MIVIPMAGRSRRFAEVGYKVPKYKLRLNGQFIFDLAVSSFRDYFRAETFVFVCLDETDERFVSERAVALGIQDFRVVLTHRVTSGQAETVHLGLREANDVSGMVTVFNIDTFRPGFCQPDWGNECSYLEVFYGSGSNWSNVLPDVDDSVLYVAEKKEISNLCCTGVYVFCSRDDYEYAYERELKRLFHVETNQECFVAPIYNHLIQRGDKVRYRAIDVEHVVFCGTPDEYWQLGGRRPQ